jgi:hypothetical protein
VWKGIGGGKLERQTQPEKKVNIIDKGAQEDVNTLYSVLNNNNNYKQKENTCKLIGGGNTPGRNVQK